MYVHSVHMHTVFIVYGIHVWCSHMKSHVQCSLTYAGMYGVCTSTHTSVVVLLPAAALDTLEEKDTTWLLCWFGMRRDSDIISTEGMQKYDNMHRLLCQTQTIATHYERAWSLTIYS